jgi:hypothetical protein
MSTPDINPSNMHLVTHLLSDTLEVSFWKEPRIAAVMNTVRFICLTGVVFIFISEVRSKVFKRFELLTFHITMVTTTTAC